MKFHNLIVSWFQIIYVEDIKVESSNSTLEGTVEIHIDSPYKISCIDFIDEEKPKTDLKQVGGGLDQKFVIIEVRGKYGSGINLKIIVRGTKIESEFEELQKEQNEKRKKIAEAPQCPRPTSTPSSTSKRIWFYSCYHL